MDRKMTVGFLVVAMVVTALSRVVPDTWADSLVPTRAPSNYTAWGAAVEATASGAGPSTMPRQGGGTTILVLSTDGGTGGRDCTLRDAITAANDDSPAGGCPAGSGADTIVLEAGATYSLTEVDNNTLGPNGLPVIASEITMEGNGARIERRLEAAAFRILYAAPAAILTLRDLSLANGLSGNDPATGWSFDGGGIYNAGGTMLLDGVQGISGNATANVAMIHGEQSYRQSGHGGGIYNKGTLTIRNSRIDKNSTGAGDPLVPDRQAPGSPGDGGGIYNTGSMTVQHTLIVENQTGYGGGLGSGSTFGFGTNGGSGGAIYNAGSMTVQNSEILSNHAGGGGFEDYGGDGGQGGGVFNQNGDLTLLDATLDDNGAGYGGAAGFRGGSGGSGGGLHNDGGTVRLIRSTVSRNAAGWGGYPVNMPEAREAGGNGGGVYSRGGSLTVESSTISGNEAGRGGDAGAGGGIAADTVHVLSSTITDNRTQAAQGDPSGGEGGGIDSPEIWIDDSILAGNRASGIGADCHGKMKGARFDLIGDLAGCVIPADAAGLLSGEAHLGPLQPNGGPTQTHALCTGPAVPDPACTAASPAIDAASGALCLATDQRGVPRPSGAGCDMGAYESDSLTSSCVGDCDQNGAVTVDELVLAVNVALGSQSVSACSAADADADGAVTIDELVGAVNAALAGCDRRSSH